MTPILTALFSQGLSLLGNAVISKGKQAIEEKLGVSLDEAVQSPEGILKLKQLEISHAEFLVGAKLEQEKVAQGNVTERWKADMLSDSWLSKNIRPLVLAFMTVNVFILAYTSQWLHVDVAFVELLKVSYTIVLTAYFLGRSAEKYIDMKERGK